MTAAATPEVVPFARLLLALHEAGHGCAVVLLGQRCDGLKLDAERSGVAFRSVLELPPADSRVTGPWPLIDPRVRERVENDLVVALSGAIAVAVWGTFEEVLLERSPGAEVDRVARELEADLEYLQRREEFDAPTPLERRTDDELVFSSALLWTGRDTTAAAALVRWAVAATYGLVRSREFALPLARLTLALVEHGQLPGDEVHRIVDGSTEEQLPRSRAAAAQPRRATGAGGSRPVFPPAPDPPGRAR